MRWHFIFVSAAVLIFIINAAPFRQKSTVKPQVIYGGDDRLDYFQVSDPQVQALADSTAAYFSSTRIQPQGATTRLLTSPYGATLNLCASEPFYNQQMGPNCTGFLVTPDLLVSAGHCIQTQMACDRTKYVFGFKITQDGVNPQSVPTSEVYSCKELVYSTIQPYGDDFPNGGADFSILRLDRAVVGHKPLTLRSTGRPAVGDELMVIGYPSSLPVKIAGGAHVRSLHDKYIVANTDTYGGNSGSPVFNVKSGEVEGVLVRGETDYVLQNGCYVSKRCLDDTCRGEDVTRISEVIKKLQVLQ
jgi:V8-like Glu-specific endopeptidase